MKPFPLVSPLTVTCCFFQTALTAEIVPVKKNMVMMSLSFISAAVGDATPALLHLN
jgi:hypothetical protein